MNESEYEKFIEKECTFSWPGSFDIVSKEANACRNGIAIFDQSYLGKYLLSGKNAPDAIEWLCAADIVGKEKNSIVYTPICNNNGTVEMDLTVTKLEDDSYYFCAGGLTASKDYAWIQNKLIEKNIDCHFENKSDDITIISLQGPFSEHLVKDIVQDYKHIDFSKYIECYIDNVLIKLLRITFVGELGYELHVPFQHAESIYKKIWSVGSDLSSKHKFPFLNAGYAAMDSLSAEKNFRHWHADLSNSDTIYESGLGFTTASRLREYPTSKFLGKEATLEQKANGVRRKHVCLTVDDPNALLHANEPIHKDGKSVGLTRSAAYGHTLQKSIVTGYVDHDSKILNSWLKDGIWKVGKYPATLHIKAPYDPENLKMK